MKKGEKNVLCIVEEGTFYKKLGFYFDIINENYTNQFEINMLGCIIKNKKTGKKIHFCLKNQSNEFYYCKDEDIFFFDDSEKITYNDFESIKEVTRNNFKYISCGQIECALSENSDIKYEVSYIDNEYLTEKMKENLDFYYSGKKGEN